MRILILLLLAFPAFAQNIGWAQCTYTKPEEKIVAVKITFLQADGSVYSFRTLKDASLKSQVLTFKTAASETLLGSMRLECEYLMPNLKSYKSSGEPVWLEPIKIPAGIAPKLGVLVDDSTGFRRVMIGKQ